MHKPLFVISFSDLGESRYIPTEEEVWEQAKNNCDYVSPAQEDEWTEKTFEKALSGMFDGITTDGKSYFIPMEAVKSYLAKKAEAIKNFITEHPLTADGLCRWKNRLQYGIFEEGLDFIIDGEFEHEIDFASRLLSDEKAFAKIKLEAIYDAHY